MEGSRHAGPMRVCSLSGQEQKPATCPCTCPTPSHMPGELRAAETALSKTNPCCEAQSPSADRHSE